MKLEVGMYVRTKYGKIYRLSELDLKFEMTKENVIKASHNLIDLIEVGDYVNEYLVENITSVYDNGEEIITLHIASGSNYFQHNINDIKEIKSIVTKEQFESMLYKIESRKLC